MSSLSPSSPSSSLPVSPPLSSLSFMSTSLMLESPPPPSSPSPSPPPTTSRRYIDLHHHFFPPGARAPGRAATVGWRTPTENMPWSPEVSLRTMDALGITTAILSLPNDAYATASRADARALNERAARICSAHPGRFGFFACMPAPSRDAEGALTEIAYALDVLRADGVVMSSSYGADADAKYIGDDAFDPMWAALDARAAVVFLHGAQTPSSTPWPHAFLGLPISEVPNETFKAAAHLVVTGKKRRFQRAKIVLAHLGGSTPFLAPRVAALAQHMGCPLSPEQILDDFRTFYYEIALSAHATTLTAMHAFVAPEQLLFGTDFPAVNQGTVEWFTRNAEAFYEGDPAQMEALMRGNALRILPRLSGDQ